MQIARPKLAAQTDSWPEEVARRARTELAMIDLSARLVAYQLQAPNATNVAKPAAKITLIILANFGFFLLSWFVFCSLLCLLFWLQN